jgi:hypothetical protein
VPGTVTGLWLDLTRPAEIPELLAMIEWADQFASLVSRSVILPRVMIGDHIEFVALRARSPLCMPTRTWGQVLLHLSPK